MEVTELSLSDLQVWLYTVQNGCWIKVLKHWRKVFENIILMYWKVYLMFLKPYIFTSLTHQEKTLDRPLCDVTRTSLCLLGVSHMGQKVSLLCLEFPTANFQSSGDVNEMLGAIRARENAVQDAREWHWKYSSVASCVLNSIQRCLLYEIKDKGTATLQCTGFNVWIWFLFISTRTLIYIFACYDFTISSRDPWFHGFLLVASNNRCLACAKWYPKMFAVWDQR